MVAVEMEEEETEAMYEFLSTQGVDIKYIEIMKLNEVSKPCDTHVNNLLLTEYLLV